MSQGLIPVAQATTGAAVVPACTYTQCVRMNLLKCDVGTVGMAGEISKKYTISYMLWIAQDTTESREPILRLNMHTHQILVHTFIHGKKKKSH